LGGAFLKNYVQTETELVQPNGLSVSCQMAEAVIRVKTVMTGRTHEL